LSQLSYVVRLPCFTHSIAETYLNFLPDILQYGFVRLILNFWSLQVTWLSQKLTTTAFQIVHLQVYLWSREVFRIIHVETGSECTD